MQPPPAPDAEPSTRPDAGPPAATVIGEALLDIVEDAVTGERSYPGGSPANVAVALARLGLPVELLTRVGRDDAGERVLDHLASNEVGLPDGTVDGRPTSTARVHLDARGVASYRFDLEWDLAPGARGAAAARVLHVGSLGTALAPGSARVLELVTAGRERATVSYDPNCRPAITPDRDEARAQVEEWVALADVVKVSSEDLEWLYDGPHDAGDLTGLAETWLALGPAAVVVTRGPDGALAVCAAGTVDHPSPAVDLVDTIGAGDSFMAGLLVALDRAGLLGGPGREALRAISTDQMRRALGYAAAVAAVTCSRPGADPPTAAEVPVG